MRIDDTEVYGLQSAVKASKYPMSVDAGELSGEPTETTARLARAPLGTGHDNFLQGIVVQFDLTASLKLWPQLQRYHFIDIVSSQSTMHRITKFDVAAQCNRYVTSAAIENLRSLVRAWEADPSDENYLACLYNIPSGFELTARLTTNYRQLKTVYRQRKNHKLPEWKTICNWIKTLPHSDWITGED